MFPDILQNFNLPSPIKKIILSFVYEFLEAVEKNLYEIAKLLLNSKQYKTHDINSALCIAVKNQNLQLVKLLLSHGATDKNSVWYACNTKNQKIFRLLLEYRIDISSKNIERVLKNGDIEIAQLFLEYKINFKNESLVCAETNQYKIIELLIIEKEFSDFHIKYSLAYASSHNFIETLEVLLRYGANVHYKEDYPLRMSSKYGYISVVKLLLEYDADAYANNEEALLSASENGHHEIVQLILEYKSNKYTRLDEALLVSVKNNHIKTVQLLIKYGANISVIPMSVWVMSNKNIIQILKRQKMQK